MLAIINSWTLARMFRKVRSRICSESDLSCPELVEISLTCQSEMDRSIVRYWKEHLVERSRYDFSDAVSVDSRQVLESLS